MGVLGKTRSSHPIWFCLQTILDFYGILFTSLSYLLCSLPPKEQLSRF